MYAAHAEALQTDSTSFVERVNGPYHELALRTFMVIVLAHWAEHLLQAFQIYALGWPVPEARGLLGYYYPWLIKSETLHYGYALVMLAGLWLFRPGFTGVKDRRWWTLALGIQFFHHIEHFLLTCRPPRATTSSDVRCRRASSNCGCLASNCICSTTPSSSSR